MALQGSYVVWSLLITFVLAYATKHTEKTENKHKGMHCAWCDIFILFMAKLHEEIFLAT